MASATASILVVDDEVDICRNMADILGDLGYRVDIAHDGPSALDLVRQWRYDVALLDLVMPGMDGAALYEQIKQLRAETVAVVVTAHPGSPRAEAAVAAGAWRVVAKPADLPRLLGLVGEALGQPLVLVVDDDIDLCVNLWDVLRERGYRVCLAHDAPTAAARWREGGFAVLLLDVRLPGGDGGAVFRAAREVDAQARVVVITGYPTEAVAQLRELEAGGARAVLSKPLDVPKLLGLLAELTA